MDGYDWVNWIDEYHCTDYWHSTEDFVAWEDDLLDDDFDDAMETVDA